MIIELFIPCFIDQLYPETAHNMAKLLKKLGHEVRYNPEQTCCGQLFFNSGHWREAEKSAVNFLDKFNENTIIVSPGASCVAYIKNHYKQILTNSASIDKLNKIKANLFEITDFLVNVLKVEDVGATFPHKVCYHDSCSALREYGIKEEPRKLLAKVKGLELIEMENTEVCCGFGGTFAIKHEPISTAMAEQKLEYAQATSAEYIVSTESSCLLNMQGYIGKHELPIKTIHIIDILAADIKKES